MKLFIEESNPRFEFGNGLAIARMSDEELVNEINKLDYYDADLLRDLCYRADLVNDTNNLFDKYCACDDVDEAMDICYKAADILGLDLD